MAGISRLFRCFILSVEDVYCLSKSKGCGLVDEINLEANRMQCLRRAREAHVNECVYLWE